MATEAKKIDRSKWSRGEWDTEPDRIEFEHAGLPCLMRRGGGGAWCGYAGVHAGHPLHGKDYGDEGVNLDAHGGLTYAGKCSGDICHTPKPGEPEDVWWFGFDCCHYMDFGPEYRSPFGESEYRNVAYVRAETEKLAEQLAALKASP